MLNSYLYKNLIDIAHKSNQKYNHISGHSFYLACRKYSLFHWVHKLHTVSDNAHIDLTIQNNLNIDLGNTILA